MNYKKTFFIISLLVHSASYAVQAIAPDFLTYFTDSEKRTELLQAVPADEKATFEKLFAFYGTLNAEEKSKFEDYIKSMNIAFIEAIAKVEAIMLQNEAVLEKCKNFCGFKTIKIGVNLSGE